MNEAVSSLGNSNSQARGMLCMGRAEIPAFKPTKRVSDSQKIKEMFLRRTDFFPKVLIGIFVSGIILSLLVFIFLMLFKAVIFL